MAAISSVVEGAVDVFATQAASSVDKFAAYALFGEKFCASTAYTPTFNISAWNRVGLATGGSISAVSALKGKTFGFPVDVVNSLSAIATRFKSFCGTVNATSAWNRYPLTVQDIREAVQVLKEANVPTFDDGTYHAFIHPTAAAGLKKDSNWASWNQYQNSKETFYKGEIGQVEGVKFMESTLVVKRPFTKGAQVSGCFTTIVGKDAFGTIDFDGGVHTYVKQPNNYDTSNPLNQWTTIGWKVTLACRILESSRGIHIFSNN
jgi:N4-gp56 family major capsid protein